MRIRCSPCIMILLARKDERNWREMLISCSWCMMLLARKMKDIGAQCAITSAYHVWHYWQECAKNYWREIASVPMMYDVIRAKKWKILLFLSHFRQANKKIDIRAWVQYMHVYMHAYIHTHTCNLYIYHTYIHHTKATHTCTYIINTYPYIHTYLHTCVHRHIHTYIHTYIHAYIQASMNVIYAATDKQLAGKGGAYIDNCKVVPRTYWLFMHVRICMFVGTYTRMCILLVFACTYMNNCRNINTHVYAACLCMYVYAWV